MNNSLSLEPQHSFLANYKLPILQPEAEKKRKKKSPIKLTTLQQKNADPRARSLRMILSQGGDIADSEEAEIKSSMAASMWQTGKSEQALKLAEQSLKILPDQWLAHRVKIDIMMARHKYEEVYEYLLSIKISGNGPVWDYPMSKSEINLCAASCQWRLKAWDTVFKHLKKAFPKGVKSMPAALQEDWFRLALYRDQPEDASAAADLLVAVRSLEFTDALLQTLVQQGWTDKALPLYRRVFAQKPRNELLRRRLVALCIREGEIDEARRLTESGALNLNP